MEENEIRALEDELVNMGYNRKVAEALAENGITVSDAYNMSVEEVFGKYLEWNGIIGYSNQIIDALDNIRNVEAL
jgi:hypothetical protein